MTTEQKIKAVREHVYNYLKYEVQTAGRLTPKDKIDIQKMVNEKTIDFFYRLPAELVGPEAYNRWLDYSITYFKNSLHITQSNLKHLEQHREKQEKELGRVIQLKGNINRWKYRLQGHLMQKGITTGKATCHDESSPSDRLVRMTLNDEVLWEREEKNDEQSN